MDKQKNEQWAQALTVAMLLAAAGGLLDAYTYLHRGGVFSSMQTGNMLMMTIRLTEGNLRGAARYLPSILAFAGGVMAEETILQRQEKKGTHHWRLGVLLTEVIVLAAAGFFPQGPVGNCIVNAMIGFACAMQLSAFRKVRGLVFASTMCTGNLRSGAEALYYALRNKSREELRTASCYLRVILSFLGGAALGSLMLPLLGQWTVTLAAVFQAAAYFWLRKRIR